MEKSIRSYEEFVKETRWELEKKLADGEISRQEYEQALESLGQKELVVSKK